MQNGSKPTITLTNQTTLLTANAGRHSEKPEEIYEFVENLCPGSKAELFSRKERKGWHQHGNEVQANAETQTTDSPLTQTHVAV